MKAISLVGASRKARLRARADSLAAHRERWVRRNQYFYDDERKYMRFVVPAGTRVLELGCGIGNLLAALRPSRGVGVDFSLPMIEMARQRHPGLAFHLGDIEDADFMASIEGPFDFIVMADTIGSLEDCQAAFEALLPLCTRDTRLVIAYYSNLWEPLLAIAERLGLKMPGETQNFMTTDDIVGLMQLAGFDEIKREWRQLLPRRLFGLGTVANRTIATMPGIRRLCLRKYVVGRPTRVLPSPPPTSATVVVPCRNERGNVEPAVTRLPRFCDDIEILFVEGHSSDGTKAEIERVIAAKPERDIKLIEQPGKGKADAVFTAFAQARGDVLMILDGDLTVPPEQMPKFWNALASGQGEFINGTRLVYPVERQAMRFLNHLANRTFSAVFSWLLNQRFTDTLCGTKVLTKAHYQRIAANRDYFGDFDPFGSTDLRRRQGQPEDR